MNRAFVKDPDDAGRPEQVAPRPQSPHTNYVTPAGLTQLKARVAELGQRRAALLDAGKQGNPQELALVQRDLAYFEERLARAIPVDPTRQPRDRVVFGATVEVQDEAGFLTTYTLVGEDEAEAGGELISWVSPLAEALLNAEVGDEVVWRRPAGVKRVEVVGIRSGAKG